MGYKELHLRHQLQYRPPGTRPQPTLQNENLQPPLPPRRRQDGKSSWVSSHKRCPLHRKRRQSSELRGTRVGVEMEIRRIRRRKLELVNNMKRDAVEQVPGPVWPLLIIVGSGTSRTFRGGTSSTTSFIKWKKITRWKPRQGSSRQHLPENTPRRRREEIRNSQKKYQAARNSATGSDENHNIRDAASPDDKQQSLHLSRERSLKSISNWWKNSLEGGPTPPTWTDGESPSPRHNHSHSDSGISSMSGRSSCMSPMSELSSSSGSSRTSLRSSSIVSASNILLEEEGETEMEYSDLCKELLIFAPLDTRIVGLISMFLLLTSFQEVYHHYAFISEDSLKPWLQVYFPEGSLEFEIITMKENCELEPSKRSRSTNFEESRKNLLKHACMRIDTQRKHQQLLKESHQEQ